MPSSAAVKIDSKQFVELYQLLLNEKNKGRHHYRSGLKENVTYYSIFWCGAKDDSCLHGHISGPDKNNVKFRFVLEGSEVVLNFDKDNDCDVPVDRLIDEMNGAIIKVHKKVLFPPKAKEKFNSSKMRGYYLWCGDTPLTGKMATNLSSAVADNEINSDFRDSCMKVGIGMRRYS